MAQLFDLQRLELVGDPVPIAEQVQYDVAFSRAMFSVAPNNNLIYETGGPGLGWDTFIADRTGKQTDSLVASGLQFDPKFSPNAQLVAECFVDPQSRNQDIWIHDLSRKRRQRLTFNVATERAPVWSPDGAKLIFYSDRSGHADIFIMPTNGAAGEHLILQSNEDKYPSDWSRDGKYLLYTSLSVASKGDIWVSPFAGDSVGKPFPFLKTEFDEGTGKFSADAKWIVYASNETGRSEIYVRPFIDAGDQSVTRLTGKWQISVDGGVSPRWRKDLDLKKGGELYYLSPDSKVMVANVRAEGQTFTVGTVRPLFDMRAKSAGLILQDVSPDGSRFIMSWNVGSQTSGPITLVTNWAKELRQK